MSESALSLKRIYWEALHTYRRRRYAHDVEALDRMPLFAPFSAGSPKSRAKLAMQAADQVFPLLNSLADSGGSTVPLARCTSEEFCVGPDSKTAADALDKLFLKHRSDKSTDHDYHCVYGHVLRDRSNVTRLLEIGLGSNNDDVVSNMGRGGSPGASLRGFRDFLPNAQVFGADIDRRILFSEDRIQTFFVDQTDLATFDELATQVGSGFDLIIDDGLHTINANLAVLIFGLPRLKPRGWLVVEDISPAAAPAWRVVARLLPPNLQCTLIDARGGLMFAVHRQ